MTTAPVQTGPATASPITEAGIPPIRTLGTPGPTMASPVTVMSAKRLAGKGIAVPLKRGARL
jgi:hypothetical protein